MSGDPELTKVVDLVIRRVQREEQKQIALDELRELIRAYEAGEIDLETFAFEAPVITKRLMRLVRLGPKC